MKLRSSDLQSDSDLDSIRDVCFQYVVYYNVYVLGKVLSSIQQII